MSIIFWKNWRRLFSSARPSQQSRRLAKRRPLHSRRLELERLEDRIVPTLTVLSEYPALNFTSSGATSVPPDTEGAAGPNSFVEAVNQAIAIYTPAKTGSNVVTDQMTNFFFTQGGLTPVVSNSQQTDVWVIFDPQVQRFIVGDLDFDPANTNGDGNQLLLAVSKSPNPTTLTKSDWNFFAVPTTETGVAFQDYPGNPGYNADALVVTLQSFDSSGNTNHSLVNAISINALVNGTPLTKGTNYFQTDISEAEVRPAVMPDSTPGGPMWMVSSFNGGVFTGSANTIDVLKMTNVLSANPTFTPTTLTVNPYYEAVSPLQPNGQAITSPGYTDSRVLKAAERSGILATTFITSNAAGNEDNSSWYAINVSSGTPVLQQQGMISGGPGIYDTYPGIDINAQGDLGMSFMQSGTGPGQYLSVYVTGRTPSDPLGTMETPVLVQAGATNYVESTAFGNPPEYRLGDMSGINVDANGNFWIINEYATDQTNTDANWGTAIANFSLAAPISVLPLSATEGQPLNNVPVAEFIDASGVPMSSYTSEIDWGDGTVTSGTVVATNTPDTFLILGSHTYINAGDYTLTVVENNGLNTLGPVSGPVTVADAPLTGSAQLVSGATGEFVTNALVAIFTDTDTTLRPPSHYTATIRWSEGNGLTFSSSGVIQTLSGNTFTVYGSTPFTFPSGGLFAVTVVITDQVGGASVTVNSVINVANNQAIPPLLPLYQSDTSPINASFVSMEDALTNFLNSEQLFLFALGFGTMQEKQGSFGNFVNAFYAYEAAVFKYDMQLPGA
ncbi:MAG: autotransporter outer membrane beta-barrel domain-containing protein [Gemmataceae bacterium]